MRRFMVHLVTEIEFVDGDTVPDATVKVCEQHLAEAFQKAVQNFSIRTVQGTRVVGKVLVAELKD